MKGTLVLLCGLVLLAPAFAQSRDTETTAITPQTPVASIQLCGRCGVKGAALHHPSWSGSASGWRSSRLAEMPSTHSSLATNEISRVLV